MKVLLDSHALVWALTAPARLSPKVRRLLEDLETELYVSSASVWELFTKHHQGKLTTADALMSKLDEHIVRLGASELAITHAHARVGATFKHRHKDPFDRMLAAQSMAEDLPIVTKDPLIGELGAKTIW